MGHCEHCDTDVPDDSVNCPQCGSALLLEPDELIGREVLGRYRIVRMLAEGGMGRVYLAEQSVGTVMRKVAIKVLRRALGGDRQLVSRFSREAETLVRLTHPNTVQLFDFGALPDGTLGLVMEYVEGHSLARELLNGALSATRVERLLTQACGALQEAHAHGIVHRDLKPDNMLVAERVGHGDFIKVLDFGIAKVSTENEAVNSTKLTQQGMIIGTPPYMSPEQFSGDAIDARSDIYSLGVIAYEMLTARLPFSAKTPWEWASRHLTAQPEALPLDAHAGLLPRHATAIRDALAKRPEDRPQTVAEFLARFTSDQPPVSATPSRAVVSSAGPAAAGVVSSSSPVGARTNPASDSSSGPPAGTNPTLASISAQLQRPRGKLALVAGAVVALLAVGVFALRSSSREPRLPPQLALPAVGVAVASAGSGALPPSTPEPLPAGASLPAEAAPPAPARTHHREHETAGSGHVRERRHGARDSAPVPSAEAPTPAAREVAVTSTPVSPPKAASPEPKSPAKPPAGVPDDLAQRISQIQLTAITRVEVAVGMFQAAAGRYGSHPALVPVRSQLASSGEKRIRELINDWRCAQAQALFRALRGITATGKSAAAFGKGCPAPG